jgi:hypothetical protein
MSYTERLGSRSFRFDDLATLLARASPERSGDRLAGIAADSAQVWAYAYGSPERELQQRSRRNQLRSRGPQRSRRRHCNLRHQGRQRSHQRHRGGIEPVPFLQASA